MLVATRDPHPGAHGAPTPPHDGRHPGPGVPRSARFVTGLQLAGSLLAIPVGLASAYSIYRTNFSVETTCQTLRANIVSMIDKQVDASTKRMLVRRDVETFEKTCGGVDPDAEAAFKALLAADKASPPVPAAAAATPRAAAPEKEVARKAAEPRPNVAAKPPAAAEPTQRDAAVSDTNWLAAVRGALVSHAPESAPAAERSRPAVAIEAPPAARPVPRENHEASKVPAVATAPVVQPVAPAPMAEPAPVEITAPALPPPTAVATVPAQQQADPDHPVPPGTIPETNPAASNSWIGKIPFVGQALVR
jgi:hypothetical protein